MYSLLGVNAPKLALLLLVNMGGANVALDADPPKGNAGGNCGGAMGGVRMAGDKPPIGVGVPTPKPKLLVTRVPPTDNVSRNIREMVSAAISQASVRPIRSDIRTVACQRRDAIVVR